MADKVGLLLEEYEKQKELFEMEQLSETEHKIKVILDDLFVMKDDECKQSLISAIQQLSPSFIDNNFEYLFKNSMEITDHQLYKEFKEHGF